MEEESLQDCETWRGAKGSKDLRCGLGRKLRVAQVEVGQLLRLHNDHGGQLAEALFAASAKPSVGV